MFLHSYIPVALRRTSKVDPASLGKTQLRTGDAWLPKASRENAALEPITARPIPPTLVNGVAGIADGTSEHARCFVTPLGAWTLVRSSRCHTICAGLFLCGRFHVLWMWRLNRSPRTLLYPRQPNHWVGSPQTVYRSGVLDC